MSDPFDDNGFLPMGESDSSDDDIHSIWALLDRLELAVLSKFQLKVFHKEPR